MADTTATLSGLGRRYGLYPEQVVRLAKLLDYLAADGLAPTTVTEPDRAVDVHLADSLVALELTALRDASSIVDIGAGAGFPGLALAVALSGGQLTLVDSNGRKCEFVARMVTAAGIENAAVVCARVEEWPDGIGAHDVALARAVGPQPVVLEYAAPLLRVGGTLVDWRGQRDHEEEERSLRACSQLGLELVRIEHVQPFPSARDRHLHTFLKKAETPERFPRRVGMARKRPLADGA
ncbi:MAG TPA: 16S rRNA (guanine(527)-N(7))-methyltransferase RsmG [Solirubrobacteraceae bacterium]|nr:16S rRNA (guanine(527)-N(7))-methyltransferase RsmG [Solirubrobacteraceae bacterium]